MIRLTGRVVCLLMLFALQTCDCDENLSPRRDDSRVPQEYCIFETFRPRCWRNEVIIMKSAIFGRMRIGRCIDAGAYSSAVKQIDPNSLGCSSNVLKLFDQKCSGRSECDVFIPSEDLRSTKPCSPQLTMYLEASFSCVSVAEDDRSCSVSVTTSPLHIYGSLKTSSGCGTRSQPWLLEAQMGQHINVSLLELGVNGPSRGVDEVPDCHEKGYVVDKNARKNISICGGGEERERNVYLSKSNVLEIVLFAPADSNFLIAFEGTGCSNLVPPPDAWLKREDNDVTVGCYSTRQRWFLRCRGNKWHGTVGTCEEHVTAVQSVLAVDNTFKDDYIFANAIAMITVTAVGFAVCLVIIFVGIACIRRYSRKMLPMTDQQRKCVNELGAGLIEDSLNHSPLHSNTRTHVNSGDKAEKTQSSHVTSDSYKDPGAASSNFTNTTASESYRGQGQYFVLDPQAVDSSFVNVL